MRCNNLLRLLLAAAIEPAEGVGYRLRRGFSLVEILIVVVIISIAALMAVPMFSSAGSMQIGSAANIIAADLEYAKSMAITRGQNYSVVFYVTAESYRIVDQSGNVVSHPVKKGFDYVVDFKNEGRLSKVVITSAQFLPNTSSTIAFDNMGMPYSGTVNPSNSLNSGSLTISADGATTTISVEPVTGYITISN
jgi:prepilin-type N-terminal cleavage/methylation domain-containing protein